MNATAHNRRARDALANRWGELREERGLGGANVGGTAKGSADAEMVACTRVLEHDEFFGPCAKPCDEPRGSVPKRPLRPPESLFAADSFGRASSGARPA